MRPVEFLLIKHWPITLCIVTLVMCCGQLKSQDFIPTGVVTLHVKFVDTPISNGFVPFLVDDQYFICTPIDGGITPESRVGVQLSNDRCIWAPLFEIVENGRERAERKKNYFRDTSAVRFYFIPLSIEPPSSDEAELVWTTIRHRSVDLRSASKDTSIPKTAFAFGYCTPETDSMDSRILEVVIESIEEFPYVRKNITGVPLYHYKLGDGTLQLSDSGSAVFRSKVSNKEEAQEDFLGISLVELGKETVGENHFVFLHPLTILSLYEQHLRFASKAQR